MANKSSIEWTEATWNPMTGCTKRSPGCKNCYAERLALRLQAMGNPKYANGFKLTMHEEALEIPLRWKKPRTIFVNSMSDLFHEKAPVDFIMKVFDVMCRANWHCFQILTKRSSRLLELNSELPWMPHIWMGVTVENQDYSFRVEHLLKTDAMLKFLSLEPLLGSVNLSLEGIDWVIVGGESGPKALPMKEEWVDSILRQCRQASIPFFFKQWGGVRKHLTGRELHGRTYDEMPLRPG